MLIGVSCINKEKGYLEFRKYIANVLTECCSHQLNHSVEMSASYFPSSSVTDNLSVHVACGLVPLHSIAMRKMIALQ